MHPNIFADIALGGYPLFVWFLFRRYRPQVAVTLSLMIAEMVLPANYNLAIHPNWLGKSTIPPLATGIFALIYARPFMRGSRPFRGIESFFLLLMLGAFFTWVTNRDPIQYGPVTLQPQVFSDFVSDLLRAICDPWLGFFLGRVLFRKSRDLATLSRLTTILIAVFTIPILYEIRMSPQISNMVYGFVPSAWGMVYRWGGFRPLVFFPTGLHLTSFLLTFTVTTVAAVRSKMKIGRVPMGLLWAYLVVVLVLCKSTGAIIYALLLVPLVRLGTARTMQRVARIVTLVLLAYPVLRYYDLIPTEAIANFFSSGVSAERADSLDYRFKMERGMIDLASLRPWFGWGGYSRGFVHDPSTGATLSIPDGAVIIRMSVSGWIGLIAYMFPFAYSILRAPRYIRRIKSRSDRLLLSGLTVNCAVILLDMIFNTDFFPIYMLLFGALYGLSSGIVAEEAEASRGAWAPSADFQQPALQRGV